MKDGVRRAAPPRSVRVRPTRIALSVAGSDSGGGAGIQADLHVFSRLGVFGTTAITAITAQNTRGINRWTAVEPALVRAQIDAVADDLRPQAVKSGMLANAGIVSAVADALRRHGLAPYVLDPVIVASAGTTLLDTEGVAALRDQLVPLATIITPNLDEAAVLTGESVLDVGAMERAARALVVRLGARAALVTGGHLPGATVTDVLFDGHAQLRHFRHRRIPSRHTHGTGCTLSAALTAYLALGTPLDVAVRHAISYVCRALRHPPAVGAGRGPVG